MGREFHDVAFPDPLRLEYLEAAGQDSEEEWLTLSPYVVSWRDADNKFQQITVPTGFITDLSSIPAFARSIIGVIGRQNGPSLVHDYQYQERRRFEAEGWSRDEVDALFLAGMVAKNVPEERREAMYRAVKGFGERQWLDDD